MVKNNYLWGNSFVKDFFFIHCKSITILNVWKLHSLQCLAMAALEN
jgi:hypothetical protein